MIHAQQRRMLKGHLADACVRGLKHGFFRDAIYDGMDGSTLTRGKLLAASTALSRELAEVQRRTVARLKTVLAERAVVALDKAETLKETPRQYLNRLSDLLFVLGLLLIVRDRWMLVKTVTAFTLAHSISLAVATFGVATVAAAPDE